MSRLIVHIGAGKTGSTSIQHTLSCNVRQLEDAGIIYPRIPGITRTSGPIDHNQLAYALFDNRPGIDIVSVRREFSNLAYTGKTILLSAEVFYMRPFETDYPDHKDYIEEKRNAIHQTKDLLSAFSDIKVVCYIRRQDLWFESIYNERVKQWKTGGISFADFLAGIKEYHFSEQLNLWADVFGSRNLVVRPYEKCQLRNSDVVDDFLSLLGLEASPNITRVPENKNTVNPRLSRDVLEFQKIIYRLKLDEAERRCWQQVLWNVSDEMLLVHGEPISWQRFISVDEREHLLDKYASGNRYIAQKYLGRNDGILFMDPVEAEEEWYPGLSPERTTEIWLRSYSGLKSAAVQRWLFIHRLRNWVHLYLPFLRILLSPLGRYYQRMAERKQYGYE